MQTYQAGAGFIAPSAYNTLEEYDIEDLTDYNAIEEAFTRGEEYGARVPFVGSEEEDEDDDIRLISEGHVEYFRQIVNFFKKCFRLHIRTNKNYLKMIGRLIYLIRPTHNSTTEIPINIAYPVFGNREFIERCGFDTSDYHSSEYINTNNINIWIDETTDNDFVQEFIDYNRSHYNFVLTYHPQNGPDIWMIISVVIPRNINNQSENSHRIHPKVKIMEVKY